MHLVTGSSMNGKMSSDLDQHHEEPSLQNQGKIEEQPDGEKNPKTKNENHGAK